MSPETYLAPLQKTDLDRCVTTLPERLREILQDAGPALVVAGGFIRSVIGGETINDIDVWATSAPVAREWSTDLSIRLEVPAPSRSINSYTVRRSLGAPVQFIHRWTFDAPDALIKSFDFTIAQAGIWWDGKEWRSLASWSFYADVFDKRLVYLSPIREEAAAGSLFRVFKFFKRGYTIDLANLSAVLERATKGVVSREELHATLCEAGSRLPAPPKRCEVTSDDTGVGTLERIGSSST